MLLLVYVDDYMDERNQDLTITRQACSFLCHDFWTSLYSFSVSFFCIYFHFDHAASVIGKRENYRTSTLTSQQHCRRCCVTLRLITCRFVALSFCTSTQYSPLPASQSLVGGIETHCTSVSPKTVPHKMSTGTCWRLFLNSKFCAPDDDTTIPRLTSDPANDVK